MYQRKRPLAGATTLAEQVAAAFRHLLDVARLLEAGTGRRATVGTGEVSVKLADRLNAPNTPETLAAARPQIEAALTPLLGPVTLDHQPDPAKLAEVTVRSAGTATVGDLLQKSGALAAR